MDAKGLAITIDRMVKDSTDKIANRTFKRGIIASVHGKYCDVYINGNSVATQNLVRLTSYTPVVGDNVLVLSMGESGSSLLILGKISS